ncbi:L,D-transpeptidase, partial [Pantanalinema rosaneae CENA516]|uniref:L,D-transpeptidase n=1 Tax=Pantanalinema rosaneae TaxID=1620701 RepID=UPI003D6FCD3C
MCIRDRPSPASTPASTSPKPEESPATSAPTATPAATDTATPTEIPPGSNILLPKPPGLQEQPGNIVDFGTEPSPPEVAKPLRLEIQLSKRQVTLYEGEGVVKRYPIAVGRPGWETPKGKFRVEQMFKNPIWVSPLQKGVTIPGGDPDNPLGRHWIGFWTDGKNWIGFHGTPNPRSVGTAASHGCIRMYNKDIEDLFHRVSLGVEVTVID